mmetsp:Transcript_65565/g.182274  ORF Transcript_65565/g.182274 Transcript_65565/m.182274 type:complete len:375 (-) Transcript_65565:85-1209(-)
MRRLLRAGPARDATVQAGTRRLQVARVHQFGQIMRADRERDVVQLGDRDPLKVAVTGADVKPPEHVHRHNEYHERGEASDGSGDARSVSRKSHKVHLGWFLHGVPRRVEQCVLVFKFHKRGIPDGAVLGGGAHGIRIVKRLQPSGLRRGVELQKDPWRCFALQVCFQRPQNEAFRLLGACVRPLQHRHRAQAELTKVPGTPNLHLPDDNADLILDARMLDPHGQDLREMNDLRVLVLGQRRNQRGIRTVLHLQEKVATRIQRQVAKNDVLQFDALACDTKYLAKHLDKVPVPESFGDAAEASKMARPLPSTAPAALKEQPVQEVQGRGMEPVVASDCQKDTVPETPQEDQGDGQRHDDHKLVDDGERVKHFLQE